MSEIHFEHKPVLFKETIESLNIDPEGTYIAVSYTHLDVYKRQVQDVFETGANNVYRIVNGAGEEFLFPAVEDVYKRQH